MLAIEPGDAKAIAVLFPGGSGKVNVKNDGTFKGTKGNFLTRSREKFSAHGLVTVLFDAPSDHKDKKGLTFEYRMTEEHAGDIKLAIAKLRKAFPGLPVWLVGTSRGSTSAANVAANIKDGGPDGVVLTSSVGVSSKHGGNVLDFDLAGITLPVLVTHHQEDGCGVTPVSGAKDIKVALTGSKSAELMIFEGGDSGSGRECGATSHHGYLGIEQKVVDAIAAWIKSH
ncbi:MAG: alpha/beta hydrolase [Rhodospirillales bacterium]|nr:alpha/beta hydrolase [Rhodospirillales bacterium]